MGRRHTVAAVAFDDVAPFELSVACEVFGIDRSDLGVPWYRFFVAAVGNEPVETSAGTAAGIDLCLHVVRKDLGADIANAVARRMVVPPHRDGGQAQYIDDPIPDGPGADLFSETITWLQEHLGEVVTVEELAARSAMSPRTFARRFRATTGTTPMQWVLRQRVLLAQRLLETTDETVDRVAELAGFGSPASLRQHFNRTVRTSPTAYRRAFRQEEP